MEFTASPPPPPDLIVVLRTLISVAGGWGLAGRVVQRMLETLCGQMERLLLGFRAGLALPGRLGAVQSVSPSPSRSAARDRQAAGSIWRRPLAWLEHRVLDLAGAYDAPLGGVAGGCLEDRTRAPLCGHPARTGRRADAGMPDTRPRRGGHIRAAVAVRREAAGGFGWVRPRGVPPRAARSTRRLGFSKKAWLGTAQTCELIVPVCL